MNNCINVNIGFFQHPKTFKLQREVGDAGIIALMRLWTWATEQRPNGDLSGLDNSDIEYVTDWRGEPGSLTAALVKLRWLDGEAGQYTLHDWAEHSPDPSGAGGRTGKNRLRSLARYHPETYKRLKAQGVTSLSASEYAALTSNQPDPLNLDDVEDKGKTAATRAVAIAAALAPILDPAARGGTDEQTRAAEALMIFPHTDGKVSRAEAVEWAARMKINHPGADLLQAIQDAALAVTHEGKTIKNPVQFMEGWLEKIKKEK